MIDRDVQQLDHRAATFLLNPPFFRRLSLTDVNSLDLLLNHLSGPTVSVNNFYYVGDNNVHHQVIDVS